MTSQQLYQQTYYYMRKYKQQKVLLEEELEKDDLDASLREKYDSQLNKIVAEIEDLNQRH